MRYFIILTFLFLGFNISAQIVGGAGIIHTNTDPNTISSLNVLNRKYSSEFAFDTVLQKLWRFNGSLAIGSRWQGNDSLISPPIPITRVPYSDGTKFVSTSSFWFQTDSLNAPRFRATTNGTAVLPAFKVGEGGMYSDGTNLNFSVANVERWRLTPTGRQLGQYGNNVIIGGGNETMGGNNTIIGVQAGNAFTTGMGNVTAIGYRAMQNTSGGGFMLAIGANSLRSNTSGQYLVAIGYSALTSNTTASNNTAIGAGSLEANTTGFGNTAIGTSTLALNISGSDNTAIGSANSPKITGSGNTAIGSYALSESTSASDNTSIGFSALKFSTGGSNTAIGKDAALNTTTGTNVTAIGYNTRPPTATTSNYVTIGDGNVTKFALRNNITVFNLPSSLTVLDNKKIWSYNSTLGEFELTASTAWDLLGNSGTSPSTNFIGTTDNVGLSFRTNNALSMDLSVKGRLGIYSTLNNTFVGQNSGNETITGTANVAIGDNTGTNLTTGAENTAVGYNALNTNTTGSFNVALGRNAGRNVSGSNNVVVGYDGGTNGVTLGSRNTILGNSAGGVIGSGTDNTVIGYNANVANGAINSMALGNGASVVGDNKISIGNTAITAVGIGTTSPTSLLHVVGTTPDINIQNIGTGTATLRLNNTGSNYTISTGVTNQLGINDVTNAYTILTADPTASTGSVNLSSRSSTISLTNNNRILASTTGSVSYPISSSATHFNMAASPIMKMYRTSASVATGDNIGSFVFGGQTAGAEVSGVSIDATAGVNWTGTNQGSILSVKTVKAGTSVLAERFRINEAGNTSVGGTVETSHFNVGGSMSLPIRSTTASTTLGLTDYSLVITGSGAVTVTLPAASFSIGRVYVVINQRNTTTTIGSYIDKTGATQTNIPVNTTIMIQSDGTNFYQIL